MFCEKTGLLIASAELFILCGRFGCLIRSYSKSSMLTPEAFSGESCERRLYRNAASVKPTILNPSSDWNIPELCIRKQILLSWITVILEDSVMLPKRWIVCIGTFRGRYSVQSFGWRQEICHVTRVVRSGWLMASICSLGNYPPNQ